MPELSISKDKISFLATKAREFAGKDIAVDPDDSSNPSDDRAVEVLEDHGAHHAVVREFAGFVNALTEDEQIDLVALMRLGRGDGSVEQWQELRQEAARGHNQHTARYLLGEPLCGDLIEEGLNRFEAA